MSEGSNSRKKTFGSRLTDILGLLFLIFVCVVVFLPLVSRPGRPHISKAKLEEADLVNAINAYYTEYARFPLADSTTVTNLDITCGIDPVPTQYFGHAYGNSGHSRLITTNSAVVIILMDLDFGVNAGHKSNPKQIKFLTTKIIDDTTSPGVSQIDHEYRDPWGTPYVITMDLNNDGLCSDYVYQQQAISQTVKNSQIGFNSLSNSASTNGNSDNFYLHGKVMVWSAGPDKKFDAQIPANSGVNKDNVLSWQ